MESSNCQSCQKEFEIAPEDTALYQKIKVPPPTFCPECRNIRRLSWREDRTLYKGTCALCNKPTLSIHAPGGPFTVYCRDCYHSDKWDPLEYGREYDFSKPFFTQYRRLMEAVPRPALTGNTLVNCEYSHACLSCKNCYFVFWSYFAENSQNSSALLLSKDAYDSFITDNSDHVYEALHCNRLYRVRFAYFSDDCMESAFLHDCVGMSDSFGCVNLRKKKYCLFNEQLSKDEYYKRLAYWDTGSYARLQEAQQKFRELYMSMPRKYAYITSSVNVSGDIIRDTKECQVCFSSLDGVENCKYLYFGGLNLKDSYDVAYGGDSSELLYETSAVTSSQSSMFSAGNSNSKNIRYSDWAKNSSDCFGCIGVKNKRYCILNKQYNKEEYEALVPKIIEHMNTMPYTDARGRVYRYGEFFPTELAAYAYNESLAFAWYPKTKGEVLKEGWRWQDPPERNYEITLKPEDLPDHIKDVPDSIIQDIIGCLHRDTACNEECTTAFRITIQELAFYRDMNIALPRLCPNCRHWERLRWRNGFQLYSRACMCDGVNSKGHMAYGEGHGADGKEHRAYSNTTTHFHGNERCPNEFETTYAPDKKEIVYCDTCYKAEFI